MNPTIQDIEHDITELRNLLRVAGRTRVRTLLEGAIAQNQKQIGELQATIKSSESETQEETKVCSAPPQRSVLVQLNKYGWDQSEQFMKIYVTDLKGVQSLTPEKVQSSFEKRVCRLTVSDLSGKTYQLSVGPLFHDIVPEESKQRVKTDMVVLLLKKVKAKETWPYVLAKDTLVKPAAKDALKDDELKDDPQAGLMNMLKNLYADGDDDMKRTIAKSWEQSRGKEPGMNMPGMDL